MTSPMLTGSMVGVTTAAMIAMMTIASLHCCCKHLRFDKSHGGQNVDDQRKFEEDPEPEHQTGDKTVIGIWPPVRGEAHVIVESLHGFDGGRHDEVCKCHSAGKKQGCQGNAKQANLALAWS